MTALESMVAKVNEALATAKQSGSPKDIDRFADLAVQLERLYPGHYKIGMNDGRAVFPAVVRQSA